MHRVSVPMSATFALLFVASTCLKAADVEPNDVTDDASDSGLIDVGSVTVSGGVIGDGALGFADRDFFFFEVTAEAEFPLLLTVEMTSAEGGLDGYLRVFDSAGYEIARNDDASQSDSAPLLNTYVLEAGFYFVGVSDALNPIYSPIDSSTGRAAGGGSYDLSLSLSAAPSLSASIELPDGTVPFIESLPFFADDQFIGDGDDGRLDVDRFTLSVNGPAIVTVDVTPGQFFALEPVVRVEADDASIAAYDVPRAGGAHRRIEAAVFEAGLVDIFVTGTREMPDEAGERFGSVGFYDLAVDVNSVSDVGDLVNEPNDSLLETTPSGLTGEGSVQFTAFLGDGKFGPFRGDVDFYELPAPVDQSLRIEVTPLSAPPNGLGPVVHIYAYGGETLERVLPNADGVIDTSFELRCGSDAQSAGNPEVIGVAIMGARSRPPLDPLLPNPAALPYGASPPSSLHLLDGGAGSTGWYRVTFTIEPGELPTCGSEPDDQIGDVADSVLSGTGEYVCGGTLGDGPCDHLREGVDLMRVTATSPDTTIDIDLVSTPCGVFGRVVRLFKADGAELAMAVGDTHLQAVLASAGDYYIGVSNRGGDDYDPLIACSGSGSFNPYDDVDRYELEIRLTPSEPEAPQPESPPDTSGEGVGRVFATRLDAAADSIIEIDPATGETLATLDSPESPLGGGEGLAYSGTDLFVLGTGGHYPFLYRLDPDTGDVLNRTVTWFGTGVYGDIVSYAGGLGIVDILGKSIYTVSPNLIGPVQRIDVGASAVAMRGPIAATAGSDRLYVSDAADASTVHVFDAATGALRSSFSLGGGCPCDADLDGDGDVDGDDRVLFDACDAISGVAFGCRDADLNCDGDVDADDAAIVDCQQAGAGVPPNPDCCPDGLPPVATRATSLSVVGPDVLLAGDWLEPILRRYSPTGVPLGSIALDAPIGALAGLSVAPFGDADDDGDLDLIDWAALQACFTGMGGTPLPEGCDAFDFDLDSDIDLNDYDTFQQAITGSGL